MRRFTVPLLSLLLLPGCGAGGPHTPVVVRDASVDLVATDVVGHPDSPHSPGRNLVWCSTLELAWASAAAGLGDPLLLEGAPALAERLNRHDASPEDLDEASHVARAGTGAEGIVAAIRSELEEKFGDRADPRLLPETVRDIDLLAYAYLLKSLPFAEPFLTDVEPIVFHGVPVETFGLRYEHGADEHWRRVAEQVVVLDYVGPDDFVVELLTESAGDRLVLARVTPEATLDETVREVMRRVAAGEPSALLHEDEFRAPKIDFDLTRGFPELEGRRVLNEGAQEFTLADVRQRIRFRLDERGATLESEAIMLLAGMAELEPRRLVLDGPFLLTLFREGAERPYLALWIETEELLIAR